MNGIRIKKGNRIAALCVLFLTLVSCGKTGSMDGTEIRFQVNSKGSLTKTAYAGYVFGDRRERIDWIEGDLIRISSSDAHVAGYPEWGDYVVSRVEPSGLYCLGHIEPVNSALRWWDNDIEYNFFCIYPSPATPGMSMADLSLSVNNQGHGKIDGYMPPKQIMEWEYSGSSVIGSPDMRYAYMYGGARSSYGNSVILDIWPLFSAFQFQFTAGTTSVHLNSFSLISPNIPFAGQFNVEYASIWNEYDRVGAEGGFHEIAVPLTQEGTVDGTPIEVPAGGTIEFTVFTITSTDAVLTDFSISLVGTEFGQRRLDLKYSDGQYIEFSDRGKYFIHGLTFPTSTISQVARGTKSPIQAGSPVDSFKDGVEMRNGEICLNMADEKFNHEWY